MNTIPRKKSSNLATIYINLTHSHSFCLSLFNCVNIVDEAESLIEEKIAKLKKRVVQSLKREIPQNPSRGYE